MRLVYCLLLLLNGFELIFGREFGKDKYKPIKKSYLKDLISRKCKKEERVDKNSIVELHHRILFRQNHEVILDTEKMSEEALRIDLGAVANTLEKEIRESFIGMCSGDVRQLHIPESPRFEKVLQVRDIDIPNNHDLIIEIKLLKVLT